MCLIIVGKSKEVRETLLDTAGLVADMYNTNPDGIGFMFSKGGRVNVHKVLPKNAKQARNFLAKMPSNGVDVAIHFRWKTHGAIDLEQCHPYKINPNAYMMHNGVLSHGNTADPTKSDTWHYVQDTLKPMAMKSNCLLFNEGVVDLIERDITTSNKFVIADAKGRLKIYNKDMGIEHDGIWFSNTYAWDPSILMPTYKNKWGGMYNQAGEYIGGSYGSDYLDPEFDGFRGYLSPEDQEYFVGEIVKNSKEKCLTTREENLAALLMSDPEGVVEVLVTRFSFIDINDEVINEEELGEFSFYSLLNIYDYQGAYTLATDLIHGGTLVELTQEVENV